VNVFAGQVRRVDITQLPLTSFSSTVYFIAAIKTGSGHKPVGNFTYKEMCPWDAFLATAICFLTSSHDLNEVSFFNAVTVRYNLAR
jgi:hypothetical protein